MQQDSNPNPNLTGLLVWDFKRAVHNRTPANLDELKQRCKEEAKILHNNVRDSWSQKENDDFKLLLLKVVLQAIEAGGAVSFAQDCIVKILSFSHDCVVNCHLTTRFT